MPQPSSAAPGEAALASARRAMWRQRGAAGLLVLAGLVSLGTLFFLWTHYFYVGVSACPTCGLSQNVPFEDFTFLRRGGPAR